MSFRVSDEFVKGLIRNVASNVKLARLKQPFSMVSPEPFHFPRFSKLKDNFFRAQPVQATGLEMDALHEIYGMPRDIPQMILTIQGIKYGQEFADFTLEMFGLQGDVDQSDEISRQNERTIGDDTVVLNVIDPDSLPFGAGCSYTITNRETGKCVVKIHVWRWRVFMDNSSLCLENNWHRDDLTGGGWIPFILGLVYDNPDKMVEDIVRFAPAFKLCNLVDASLSRPGRPERYENKDEFLAALEHAATQLDTDNAPITQPNIAELMGADERQIRLWCGKHKVDWSTWKRERTAKPDKTGN
jgi:hypothetical protein